MLQSQTSNDLPLLSATDIWSLAIVLFAMTAGYLPIGELNNVGGGGGGNTHNNAGVGNPAEQSLSTEDLMGKIRQGDRRPFPEWFSKPLVTLLSAMMVLNAYRR